VSSALSVASQRVFIVVVYFIMTQSGNFRIHPRISILTVRRREYVMKKLAVNENACSLPHVGG
jgi:hypothetical protein